MNKINNLSKDNNSTSCDDEWQEIKQMFKENELRIKETDQQIKETGQLIKELSRSTKETERFLKDLSKQVGGVSNSNGDVAESYFINSFEKHLFFAGQDYDSFMRNLEKKNKKINLQAEYDLVLYNCSSVAIIEIKYKADKDDVEQVIKKADTFKKLFPEYKDYAIYLGLAGLHINKDAEKKAIKQGVGIIKQVGKNMVINDAHLKVF
jgi:hypothetical protein